MNVNDSVCIGLCLLASVISSQGQGSLHPPGPPGDTMRSLDQLEPRIPISSVPFSITQPGSYYLTGNLAGTTQGITIAASDVLLDLNGFALTGDYFVFGHGLIVVPSDKVVIQGGVIKNWGGNGVEAPGVTNLTLQNLRVRGHFIHGIHMGSGRLIDVSSEDNGSNGIKAGSGMGTGKVNIQDFHRVVVSGNGGGGGGGGVPSGGISYIGPCDVSADELTVRDNTGYGMTWASVQPGDALRLRFRDCDLSGNTGHGLRITEVDDVDVDCDFNSVSFRHNGGDGLNIQLAHIDSYFTILHHQGRYEDNAGDGMNITAARDANQGFFDVFVARNAGAGCNKIDGGSSPGTFKNSVIQDNGGPGLNLVGGTWTLESCTIKGNGSDGVTLAARKHTKTGHVSLLKRGGSSSENAGNGVRVYPFEADADCRVVMENAHLSGNASNGIHVVAALSGSSITLDWIGSTSSGNDEHGMLINPIAMDKGLRFRAVGGACDNNLKGGITIDGDGTEAGTVSGVDLRGNGDWGVLVKGGSWRFAHCTAIDNVNGGFRVEKPTAAYKNNWGDFVFEGCDAIGNGLAGLALYNFDVLAPSRARIEGGRFHGNSNLGIDISGSPGMKGSVRGADVATNTLHGIYAEGTGWSITDNIISQNGAVGIFVSGDRYHLARNECSDNAIGIYLEGAGSAVRENTFSGATQVSITDNSGANVVAPLQDVITGVNPLGNIVF